MAITTIVSSITRSTTYPVSVSISADSNCGTLCFMPTSSLTQQMIAELPAIMVGVILPDGSVYETITVNIDTVNRDVYGSEQQTSGPDVIYPSAPHEPYSIPLFDLPESCSLSVTPLFDDFAIEAHNADIDNGIVGFLNTSNKGIVTDTNQDKWTAPTSTFPISIKFDNTNISSGGGGGSQPQITVDQTVQQNSQNPVAGGGVYDFVNSSVSTNTANFIGTFNSVADLEAYSGTVTNNDYAFVISTDSSGNTVYNRYKYNGDTQQWLFEYSLNNSSFTANQWATINSGITGCDDAFDSNSSNPVQNAVITGCLTPITQQQYDALQTKTMPLYFIYEV